MTPLLFASYCGHSSIAESLIKSGAEVDAVNKVSLLM